MHEFQPRLASLPAAQQALWTHLSATLDLGFTLYGGTALAVRLGHRVSLDFDFFSDRPLDKREIRRNIPVLHSAQVLQDTPDTLTALIPIAEEFVKVSFFGGLSFGRVGEPELTTDRVLEVASIPDLFGTKLKAMFDRVEAKDYRDVIAILKTGCPLETGLSAARALFGSSFQPAEALKILTYFEGGDLDALTLEEREFLERHAVLVSEIPTARILSHRLSLPRGPL